MNNNVTAVIITGSSEEVSNFINNTFQNISNVKFLIQDLESNQPARTVSSVPSVKYKYERPTYNFSCTKLNHSQKKTINNFLRSNNSFRFRDLVTYLKSNTKYLPSNAAISNHLNSSNYTRHQNVLADKTSYFTWDKND